MARNTAKFIIEIDDRGQPVVKETAKDFKRLEGQAGRTGGAFKALRSHWLALTAAMAVGIYAVSRATKSFIEAASYTEGLSTRLRALLGSVVEGNRLFKLLAEFAGKVPFEYREVMASATQLAGIMKGGTNEIMRWMPLIADLAAAAGLGIEITTGQIMRMLSAGAASADMFRERGVLAMLGFQAKVQYTAEQTKQMLWDAWTGIGSKFKGLTQELAKTWGGLTSMMADAIFQLKEVLGVILMPAFKFIVIALTNVINRVKDWARIHEFAVQDIIKEGLIKIILHLKKVAFAVWGVTEAWYGWKELLALIRLKMAEFFAFTIEGAIKVSEILGKITGKDFYITIAKELKNYQNIWKGVADEMETDLFKIVERQQLMRQLFKDIRQGITSLGKEVTIMWPKLTGMMEAVSGTLPPQLPGPSPEETKKAADEAHKRALAAVVARIEGEKMLQEVIRETHLEQMTLWDEEREMLLEKAELYENLGNVIAEFISMRQLELFLNQTIGNAMRAAILGYQSFGKALKQAVAETLASLAAEAAVKSIMALAEGFYLLANMQPALAASAFKAAALYAAVTVAAGTAAKALAAGPGGAERAGYGEARGGEIAGLGREGEFGGYAQKYEITIINPIGTADWVEDVLIPELKRSANRDIEIVTRYG